MVLRLWPLLLRHLLRRLARRVAGCRAAQSARGLLGTIIFIECDFAFRSRLDRDKEIDGHSTAHRLNVHADGHVCSACHGQLTDNRGTRTPVFESCFKAMDEACDADGHDRHSFCHSIRKSPRGLNEIIKVENWKTQHCHWAMEDLRH